MENGRVMLSQHPTEDKGVIYVFVGLERKTLGVRAAQIAYDLPDNVQPDQVTSVEYVVEPVTPPGEGRTVEEAKEAAIADGSEKEIAATDVVVEGGTSDVTDDKVAE